MLQGLSIWFLFLSFLFCSKLFFFGFIGPENKLSHELPYEGSYCETFLAFSISAGLQLDHLFQLELVCFPGQELGGQSKTVTASEVVPHRKKMWKINDKQSFLVNENLQISIL